MQISAETHRKCDIVKVSPFYYHHHMKWEKIFEEYLSSGGTKRKIAAAPETETASRNNRWSILTFILTISPFYFPFLPLYPDLTTPYVKCYGPNDLQHLFRPEFRGHVYVLSVRSEPNSVQNRIKTVSKSKTYQSFDVTDRLLNYFAVVKLVNWLKILKISNLKLLKG